MDEIIDLIEKMGDVNKLDIVQLIASRKGVEVFHQTNPVKNREKAIKKILEMGFQKLKTVYSSEEMCSCLLYNETENIFVEIAVTHSSIFCSSKTKAVDELIKFLKSQNINGKTDKVFILCKLVFGGMSLMPFPIKSNFNVDIENHYSEDFQRVDKTIMDFLEKDNEAGAVILHGEAGSGKTYYIRHLIKSLKAKDRKFIFVPSEMVKIITSPSELPFLMANKDSVFILEDSEDLIKNREEGNAQGIANVLNITDGLLGDSLGIKFIFTFNSSIDLVDKAVLRKGRLVAQHYFGKLLVEKSNKLLKIIGETFEAVEEMSLAEIFNIQKENFLEQGQNKKQKMGF